MYKKIKEAKIYLDTQAVRYAVGIDDVISIDCNWEYKSVKVIFNGGKEKAFCGFPFVVTNDI